VALERRLVLRLVRRFLGLKIAERTAALLERVSDPSILEEIGELVLDCADGGAWLTSRHFGLASPTKAGWIELLPRVSRE
jgi:hypothetical protein